MSSVTAYNLNVNFHRLSVTICIRLIVSLRYNAKNNILVEKYLPGAERQWTRGKPYLFTFGNCISCCKYFRLHEPLIWVIQHHLQSTDYKKRIGNALAAVIATPGFGLIFTHTLHRCIKLGARCSDSSIYQQVVVDHWELSGVSGIRNLSMGKAIEQNKPTARNTFTSPSKKIKAGS